MSNKETDFILLAFQYGSIVLASVMVGAVVVCYFTDLTMIDLISRVMR